MAEKQRILSHPVQNDLHPHAYPSHHYACTGFTQGCFLVHSDDQSHSTSYEKDCLSEQSEAALLPFCFPPVSSLFCSSASSPCCYHLLHLFFLDTQFSISSCCISLFFPRIKLLPQLYLSLHTGIFLCLVLIFIYFWRSPFHLSIWQSSHLQLQIYTCSFLSIHLICHPQKQFYILPTFLAAFQAFTPFFFFHEQNKMSLHAYVNAVRNSLKDNIHLTDSAFRHSFCHNLVFSTGSQVAMVFSSLSSHHLYTRVLSKILLVDSYHPLVALILTPFYLH